MNETLKKLNDEAKSAIATAISSKAFADLIATTKAASDQDSGSFKVIVSTSDQDRQGESVNQYGWDLSFFKMNPVVLWAHDYSSLPIGMCTSIAVNDGKLVAEGKFAPEAANPLAQQVRRLYELGMINATSVGFIPKEYDQTKDGLINKAELLEFSFVPVPANARALRLDQIKELRLDLAMLKTKGIEIKEEVPAIPPEAPAPAPAPEATPAPEPAKPDEPTPEPAKPAEPAPEAAKAAKGEVADAQNAIEAREMKWEKYQEICEALDAFCTVYFDDATPVEDFAKLLTETIALLQQVATEDGVDADDMQKMLAGRKSTTLNQHVFGVIKSSFAFGIMPTGGKNGKETPAAPKRSKNVEGLKEMNTFVESRDLLRMIDNSIGKVLENFNSAARTR